MVTSNNTKQRGVNFSQKTTSGRRVMLHRNVLNISLCLFSQVETIVVEVESVLANKMLVANKAVQDGSVRSFV